MAANNGFPLGTTTAAGLFNGASSTGLVQGMVEQDPNIVFDIGRGIVGQSETIPMWGGLAVNAFLPLSSTTASRPVLGPVLNRATSLATTVGFSVLNYGNDLLTTPNSPVPTAGSNMSINFVRLGSRARIAVACDPALVSLRGGTINPQVSWDFTAQMLVPYTPTNPAITITGAAWANTNGGQITYTVSTNPTTYFSTGSDIEVSGVNSTGGTGGSFNGQWVVVSTTATTIVVTAPAATGFYGTYASGGTVLAGGGPLPVTIEGINPTNCKVAVYSATTGNITWNNNGSCALIRLTGGTTA